MAYHVHVTSLNFSFKCIYDDRMTVNHMRVFGELHEQNLQAFLACQSQFLRLHPTKTNVYIDVGGHVGTSVIPMLDILLTRNESLSQEQPHIKLYSYEPQADLFTLLQENIDAFQKNKQQYITAFHKAVGLKSGRVCMSNTYEETPYKEGIHLAGRSISEIEENADSTVDVIALDNESYLQDNDDVIVQYLKMDVEGYEPFVLAGAMDIIAKHRPLICMEINAPKWSQLVNESKVLVDNDEDAIVKSIRAGPRVLVSMICSLYRYQQAVYVGNMVLCLIPGDPKYCSQFPIREFPPILEDAQTYFETHHHNQKDGS